MSVINYIRAHLLGSVEAAETLATEDVKQVDFTINLIESKLKKVNNAMALMNTSSKKYEKNTLKTYQYRNTLSRLKKIRTDRENKD